MPRAKKTDTDNTEVVEVTNEVNETTAPTFSPEVIMASERFRQYADLIAAVIENREYSIEEVEQLIQDTLNKPIVETIND
ncbi:MAG: hypothetical protein E7E17_00470 [Veillonella sp.]|nr:hypothetical protein [Veillonella sp.]DAQ93237.1 MAG TPA: hypothetical protein [Caudoviricetes sp.]